MLEETRDSYNAQTDETSNQVNGVLSGNLAGE